MISLPLIMTFILDFSVLSRLRPDWTTSQVKSDDAFVTALAALVLSYLYWGNIFAKKVPSEFWHRIPQQSGDFVGSRQRKAEERRLGYVFQQHQLDFVVLWGSQSGRSEIMARQFAKSVQDRFSWNTLAADMDDFDQASLAELKETQPCALVVSTYGDGDPPDGAEGLWSFLHSAQGEKTLFSLRYLIFGLGNSNYRQFNHVAKRVDVLLQELGATRLGNVGAGDDANGNTETDFLQWRKETETMLKQVFRLTEQAQAHRPSFAMKQDESIAQDTVHYGVPIMTSQGTATTAVVKEARKLWETDDRLCLHMDLDLGADRQLKYKTGDHLAVWPSNANDEVEALLKSLDCQKSRHTPVTVEATNTMTKLPCPSPTTLEVLFRNYLEISGRLSMDLVTSLAEFSPSEDIRASLLELSDDAQLFKTRISSPRLTLAGLLNQFSTAKWDVPISFLLERLKPMQPRYYSISSSAVVNPRIASITAVVDKPSYSSSSSPSSLTCQGLATSYLWALERSLNPASSTAPSSSSSSSYPSYSLLGPRSTLSGNKLFCTTRLTSFKLPTKASSPVILIGAGTGVAPFRAFVSERAQRSDSEPVGRTLLLMGFRNRGTDYIYRNEWEGWKEKLGGTFWYWVAASRDEAEGEEKNYVQDLVKDKKDEIMGLLDGEEGSSCRVFLCGSAAMARDVVRMLVGIRCERMGCDEKEALEWVRKMRQFGTLREDVWG